MLQGLPVWWVWGSGFGVGGGSRVVFPGFRVVVYKDLVFLFRAVGE